VALQGRVAGLRAVELTITDRLSLDIELSKVQSAFAALEQVDLRALDRTLEDPLRRLGYRLDELELAVEDFRTTSRMREAARHVEGDSEVFADEVAAFAIRARC
jgi:hypothetical protein